MNEQRKMSVGFLREAGIAVSAFLAIQACPTSWADTLLVANKSEASVTLFALPEGKEVATLPTGDGPHEIAVSPNGTMAAITNYGIREDAGKSITLVDIERQQISKTIHLPAGSKPHGIIWLNASTLAVTAEGISSLLLIDVPAKSVTHTIAIDQSVAHMVDATPDGKRAFTANIGSGTATAVDLANADKIADLPSGDGAEGIALVKNGEELWISNRGADTISIFDSQTLEKLGEIAIEGFPIRLEADDARGRVYVTLPKTDQLAVIDTTSRKITTLMDFEIPPDTSRKTIFGDRLPNSSVPVGVLLSGDGETLFVAHSASHLISVWDAESLQQKGEIETGLEPDGMDWSPN